MIKEALLLLFLAQCSFVLSDGGPTLEQKLLEWKSLQLSAERHPVGDIWTNCGTCIYRISATEQVHIYPTSLVLITTVIILFMFVSIYRMHKCMYHY